ncbi:hypothetical protein M758_UG261000 [Ceratodon purpureus]|nr:hypothetical protein M758_UG261000 [Ceratodon purpureus]
MRKENTTSEVTLQRRWLSSICLAFVSWEGRHYFWKIGEVHALHARYSSRTHHCVWILGKFSRGCRPSPSAPDGSGVAKEICRDCSSWSSPVVTASARVWRSSNDFCEVKVRGSLIRV